MSDELVRKRFPNKKPKLQKFPGRVLDANGNEVNILGRIKALFITPTGTFHSSVLVFRKNPKVIHNVLIGMNVLKYGDIKFSTNQIVFEKPFGGEERPSQSSNDILCLKLKNNQIHGVLQEKEVVKLHTAASSEAVKVEQQLSSPSESAEAAKVNSTTIDESSEAVNINEQHTVSFPSFPIYLTKDISLKKNSVNILSLAVNVKQAENIIINANSVDDILVPTMLTKITNNMLNLQLVNLNDESITLKAGTEIGKAEVTGDSNEQYINVATCKKPVTLRPLTQEDIICDDPTMTEEVLKLLNKKRAAAWLPQEPLGNYKGDELEIQLKCKTIVNKRPYRIPHCYQADLDKTIADMLQEGIIQKSKSNFNSPLIIIRKPDGSIRPCLDLREINKVIEPVSYPLPNISELLNSLGQAKYMSSLDLAQAFHQCNIKPSDREKTAFTIRNTKYEYVRVPFGLQSSPAFFARIINEILYDVLGPNCLAYLDDIIIFSKSKEQHMTTLDMVLTKLQEAGIKLKIRKCKFFASEVTFLGYNINRDGMTMNSQKAAVINSMPLPTNKKQLQAFLGTCNYYRIFIENFAQIADPLYDLLRKQVRFTWTEAQTKAVNILKAKLANAPIMKFPRYDLPFHLYTDASDTGIGAVLMQSHDGVLHPVFYISKTLNQAQRAYSATKKEALALVFALEQFRHVILMYDITVYTDHLPLLGALQKPTKDECLQRWAMLIQEYRIKMKYVKGKNNIFSDTLSRLPEQRCDDLEKQFQDSLHSRNTFCNKLNDYIPEKVSWNEAELRNKQKQDPTCRQLVETFLGEANTETTKNCSTLINDCKYLKGVLYVMRKIKRGTFTDRILVPYIPDSLMPSALKIVHDDLTAGHKGPERTLKLFVKNFYNKNERNLIKNYCDQCVSCIRAKKTPKQATLSKYNVPERPFATIVSDILGPLRLTERGNMYILTVRDYTTRYTILFPLAHKDTESIIIALRQVISNFGPSHVLLTDNAQEYKSEKLSRFLKYYNCLKKEVSPYHAASMGVAERINREVNKLLRIYVFEFNTTDWDDLLPTIQLAINSTFNVSINETPFFALFGFDSATDTLSPPKLNYSEDALTQHMQRVSEVRIHCRKKLLEAQEAYTEYANKKRIEKNISIGQRVFANTTKHCSGPRQKLDLPISGPFVVVGRKGKAWQLKELSSKLTYLVHPDYIIPSTIKNPPYREVPQNIEEKEISTYSSGSDSEHDDNVTVQKPLSDIDPSAVPTVLTGTPEPVPLRASLPRACKNKPVLDTRRSNS